MNATRTAAAAALLALFASACANDEIAEAPETPELGSATVTVDRADGVEANGADAVTVTIQLTATDGKPFAGGELQLAASGSGNVIIPPAPSDASGTSTARLSSTVAEEKVITVSLLKDDQLVALEQTPVVRFVSGKAAKLVFSVPPSNARAGTVIAPAVQVALQDARGNLVADSSSEIVLELADNPAGGALSGTTTQAASGGVARFETLRIDLAGAGYTLRARSGSLESVLSAPFAISAGAPARLRFIAEPANTVAGTSLTPAVQVAIEDEHGNRIVESTAEVTLSLGQNPGGATLGGTLVVAAKAGVASFNDTKLEKAASGYTLAATATGLAGTETAAFDILAGPPSAAKTVLAVAPSSVVADGSSPASVAIALRDLFDNPISGATVAFAASGSGHQFDATSAVTDASGEASVTLSSTRAELKQVTAEVAGGFTVSAPVTFTAGAPVKAHSTLVAAPSSVVADGVAATTLTFTLRDANDNPVPGVAVTAAATGTANTFSPASGETDASGTFSSTLQSTKAEAKMVSLSAAGFDLSSAVTFTAGAPSQTESSLSASKTSLVANGTETTTLTVTALDAHGNRVAGAAVALAVSGTANNLSAASGTTDTSGVFSATLSSTRAEAKTVTATVGAAALVASVTFVPGAPSASSSTLAISPTTVVADGASAADITVTVRDTHGNAVAGQQVTLTSGGIANTFSPASGTTDANGVFSSALTSTKAEEKGVTATFGSNGLNGLVTFVSGPANAQQSSIAGTPPVAMVGRAISLRVLVLDAFGNPVAGEPVSLSASGTGHTFTPPNGITDAEGVFTSALTASSAGDVTVTAALSTGTTDVVVTFNNFVSRVFTTCNATGPTGPTQAQCDGAYASSDLAGEVTVADGIQLWTVPFTGTYRIEAWGAQGGDGGTGATGGLGARVRGDFTLTAGEQLRILVGHRGGTIPNGGGGGGGTFVVGGSGPLLIAGAGGGGNGPYPGRGTFNGGPGLTGTSGGDSNQPNYVAGNVYGEPAPGSGGGAISRGGRNGYGGGGGVSAGGGGYYDRGGNASHDAFPGLGFLQGAAGGTGSKGTNSGGFGGGGGGHDNSGYGGGGGGYSGGGAGNWDGVTHGNGGGGGSWNGGANPSAEAGVRTGSGEARIELIQ